MDIEKERQEILEKLAKLHDNITEETIKNASKEDLEKYLKLIEQIELELELK